MTWYFLRPETPLLFRDGRLFAGTNHGPSLRFPMPQAILGAARTVAGERLGLDWDRFDNPLVGTPQAPGRLRVRHLFYARRGRDGRIEPLLPRPADLIRFPPKMPVTEPRKDEHFPADHALRPGADDGTVVSPPVKLAAPLRPLLHRLPERRPKPLPPDQVPAHLGLGEYTAWLCTAGAEARPARADVPDPDREHRVHVAIDNDSLTGIEGMLFSTERLVMPPARPETFGFAVAFEGIEPGDPDLSGPWRVGGKGGLAVAEPENGMRAALNLMRDEVLERGFPEGRIRWVLTAPARFERGWLPDFIRSDGTGEIAGVAVTLVAAAVSRPLAYSGWDLQYRASDDESTRGRAGGGPRPTRLLVPAGSTYFFQAHGTEERSAEAAAHLARTCWLQPQPLALPDHADTTALLDAACGLAAGVFGPFDEFTEGDDT